MGGLLALFHYYKHIIPQGYKYEHIIPQGYKYH